MKSSWVEIDLGALEFNIRQVRQALRAETAIMFVVKDRAYGHGIPSVVKKAASAGVDWFGVAYVHEALEVRQAAPHADILVLGAVEPGDVSCLKENRITPLVLDEAHGRALADAATALGCRLPVHLKIDTGMGRLGVLWEQAPAVFAQLDGLSGLEISGICTHFASVEVRKPSLGCTQMDRFLQAESEIRKMAKRKLFRHVSSSRAILYQNEWDLDAVRPGILLYGYGAGEPRMRFKTKPMLQWKTVVMQVKRLPAGFPVGYYSTYVTPAPTVVATIAAGYADGYHRALSNKGVVLIRGRRCPVIGRVSMNWISVDLGPDGDAAAGDEAVLIGEQGESAVWADELARMARTIPYELLTSINPSAERHYINTRIS
jgi:alanine racemase